MRVALVFARRGYNMDALVVSPTYDERFSRMTITAKGDPATLDQIIKQTAKLIDVIHAAEHTETDALARELALFKVKSSVASKAAIGKLVKKYNGRIISEDKKTLILQQTGTTEELDDLEASLKKYGMIEIVRSGKLVMAKGVEET